ncbi:MAG TPA: mechanosensitive ion channel domain-containing protein [Edaphobacter sp.]|jgi:small-conductance mechanosensitive channel|nr:mechanosensitive ion channel domain-containing protein [Edaphobacter sp.]
MRLIHIWHGWFLPFFLFCAALVFSNGIHWVVFHFLKRKQEEKPQRFELGLQRHLNKPARAIFVVTCLFLVLPSLPVSAGLHHDFRVALAIAMVISLGWFVAGMVYVIENIFLRRYDLKVENNVRARRIHTQLQLFRRIILAFVFLITAGVALYTFHDERLWRAGTGLLASAGLATLVLATAAKSTASNFLAGMQIALTEPIRIDDVVVVQGEWGRIEEITSAYVVVKCWDLRRLIVPLSYFIENSFQNWTRMSADLLGTAFLYLDYTVPVEPLRKQLQQIVSSSKQWDGKVCALQVTNLKERTMEIRCLISTSNSSDNFDLCCIIREQMMAFVQEKYPEAFPRARFLAQREGADNQEERQRLPAA